MASGHKEEIHCPHLRYAYLHHPRAELHEVMEGGSTCRRSCCSRRRCISASTAAHAERTASLKTTLLCAHTDCNISITCNQKCS